MEEGSVFESNGVGSYTSSAAEAALAEDEACSIGIRKMWKLHTYRGMSCKGYVSVHRNEYCT